MKLRGRTGLLLAASAVVALVAVAGPWASSEPDGLTKVSREQGFDRAEKDHALEDAPMAGYSLEGVDDERAGTAVAGLVGVVLTFAIGYGSLRILRKHRVNESGAP